MLIGNSGTQAFSQALRKAPLYNSVTDFTPVGLATESPRILIARKDLPVSNLQQFIAYVKANQGKMQFGSAGVGSGTHLPCVLLNTAMGVTVTHVPYRGEGPAQQDLIARAARLHVLDHPDRRGAGQARRGQRHCGDVGEAGENHCRSADHRRAGPARRRSERLERVLSAQGRTGADRAKLNKAMSDTLDDPVIGKRLEDLGLEIVPPEQRTPDYLAKFQADEVKRWAKVVHDAGITPN